MQRGMDNTEKAALNEIKKTGVAYEVKIIKGDYYVNLPIIKQCWHLKTAVTSDNLNKFLNQ